MAKQVYIVGAYVANADPLVPVKTFIPLTTECRTLAEAQRAAEQDYAASGNPAPGVSFVLYQAQSGDAIVEVSRGGPFLTEGFYKIALVEEVDGDGEAAAPG